MALFGRWLLLLGLLSACDAERPQRVDVPDETDTASTKTTARARRGSSRVTVDPRFAHVIIAQQDEHGRVVTRCVSQLEHPLDALQVPMRPAEIE